MDISIVEKETGKVVDTYTINLGGLNYEPSDEEYFAQAWKCAVEDGVVNEEDRDNYSFAISQKG